MSVIDDLKRLQRAGSDIGKTFDKLKDACVDVAAEIVRQVGEQTYTNAQDARETDAAAEPSLPRRYSIQHVDQSASGLHGLYLFGPDHVHGTDVPSYNWNRDDCLQFAKDVADGLLGEIAELLERRSHEAEQALNAVAKKSTE